MNFLLLSNVNMQPLVRLLAPWEGSCGAYNSMLADLSAIDSPAASAHVTHVLCLYDTDTLLGDALYGEGIPEQCEMLLARLDYFCLRHPEKRVIVNTFCLSSNRWLGFADVTHKASLKAAEAGLNARLAALARARPNLLAIDLEVLFRRHGEDRLVSNAFWYAARIRYTGPMFVLLAQTIRRAVDAHAHRSRKVLVLDLDDTLWGGVVGEAGPMGIALSEDGIGRCYRDFQRCLKAVQRTGVLLAAVSKNNAADVDEVFEKNPMMVLRREDFTIVLANWRPKAENIAEIAERLDLGVESFVFIDDNPVERAAIAKFLPEIAVPAFPARPENLRDWFTREIVPAYFAKYAISKEDAGKTEQYRAREARRKLAASFDLDAYLAELGIECQIHVDAANRLVRAAQMTQKTNQFNLTTRRYEVTDLARFVESPEHAVVLLDYRDRFGDEGSVGLAIVDLEDARIDTFLTSCRVIGRKVERRLLEKAVDLCRARGHQRIVGEYIPTRKNQLAAKFYDSYGFKRLAEYPDGRIMYEKPIDAGR
jgi:FkbH-like protein